MEERTKGQLEAEISTAITRFEKEHLGRGPKEAHAFIIEDMILIRLKSVLTPAEQKLAGQPDGAQLIKQMRRQLIESSRPLIEQVLERITGSKALSLHTDISTRTGERIFVFSMDKNLEAQFRTQKT